MNRIVWAMDPQEVAVDLGMVCTCSEDGMVAAAELVETARRRCPGPRLPDPESSEARLLDRLLWSLTHSASPPVTKLTIRCDQWYVITTEDRHGRRVRVACDEPLPGLARLWLHHRGR